MEFTLTIKGDAQELAALLSQIKVPPASKAVTSIVDLAQANGHVAESEAVEEAPVTPAEAPARRTRRSTPAVVVTAPEAATPTVTAPPAEAPGTTISHVPVGLDHLRKVMSTKLAHQKQIIEWLGEFGAKNLSSLAPEHYDAMYSKLNGLS